MKISVGSQQMLVQTLFDANAIQHRVKEMGLQIHASYPQGSHLVFVIVLNGALIFGADLIRQVQHTSEFHTVRLKSYEGTKSTGDVQLQGSIPEGLEGKDVIIIEDIVDTGRSIHKLLELLQNQKCRSIKTACLLDKPASHEFDVKPDFVGFSIGGHFVIGYGLDLDGAYRNLPYIAELVPDITDK